jgi:hypothetical protein
MKSCWASCLGDCDRKASREHYLSANILGEGPVTVRGLAWCRGEFKTIAPAAFTRNMLCKRHNEQLSLLDQAGGAAWRELTVFRESAKRAAMMPSNARAASLRVQAIDGRLFERWLLKTVTNIAYLESPEGQAPWTPTLAWVELVFGLRLFPDRCGLYLETGECQARPGNDNYFGARILTYPETKDPCGGQVKVNEWGMVVTLTPLAEKGVRYRPRFMRLKHRHKVFRVLRFDWA